MSARTRIGLGLLVLIWGLVPWAQAQAPIRLVTQEWPPYAFFSGGRVEGAAVDLIRCIFARMGQPLRIAIMPWPDAQAQVNQGLADGFFPASRNSVRDRYAVMSRTFIPQRWVFYIRPGGTLDPTRRPLPMGTRIGGVVGTNMLHFLESDGWPVTLRAPTVPALLDALLAGQIDAGLANALAMETALAQAGKTAQLPYFPYADQPMGVYIARRYLVERPDFLPRFNAEIEMCE